MMDFSKRYNREEFVKFLQNDFLPEDDFLTETTEAKIQQETQYIKGITKLGASPSLRLAVYEARHTSTHDARVGLSKEIFRFMANKRERKALVLFVPEGNDANYRLSLISIDLVENEDGNVKRTYSNPRRYSYYLGEGIAARTPKDYLEKKGRVKDASDLINRFSVEILNGDFFNQYKAQYKKFCDFLHDDPEMCQSFKSFLNQGKAIRDYVKKMMGRIVFLYFVQRKGWLNGDSRYMSNMFSQSSDDVKADFLDRVLEPMFFGLLNTPKEQRNANAQSNGWDLSLIPGWQNIPYLNGGLFEQDEIDKCKSVFPTAYFEELFGFFDAYNFTIDENDPDDSEVGIDPEMLGHIFENLLEDNKDKGAFYTPKEIVQYMCRESVIQYLKTHEPDEQFAEAIEHLIRDGEVDKVLQDKNVARKFTTWLAEVKVCDPAIGSGAFPMGVLNVLYHSRQLLYGFTKENRSFSPSEVKREIIQNNIYGVDIEQGAVDIARLRFWLSLVVDEVETQPLPNLDYKIVCGNSLLHRFALDAPFQNVLKDYNQKNGTNYTLGDYRQWVYDYTNLADHTQKDTFRRKIEDIKHAFNTKLSEEEKKKIAKVRGAIDNLQMEDMFNGKQKEARKKIKDLQKELKALEQRREEIESNRIYENAFEWRFEFPALLDENGNFTGFDIVIANPPYGYIFKNAPYLPLLTEYYSVAEYKVEAYSVFTECGYKLLGDKGVLTFIMPYTFISGIYFSKFRNYLKNIGLNKLVVLGKKIFAAAEVDTAIVTIEKENSPSYVVVSDLRDKEKSNFDKLGCVQILRNKFFSLSNELLFISSEEKIDLYLKMKSKASGKLSDIIKFYHGIQTRGNKLALSEVKLTSNYLPIIKGANFQKYQLSYSGLYINFVPTNIKSGGDLSFYNVPQKLVLRTTADRIIAAIDTNQYLALNSVNVGILTNIDYDLSYILGVINSELINFWYTLTVQEKNKTFAEVKIVYLEKIPIITIDRLAQKPIINTVRKLTVEIDKEEKVKLQNKIDILVYHLYGLTYDEVLIVDPETPITREDYEQTN